MFDVIMNWCHKELFPTMTDQQDERERLHLEYEAVVAERLRVSGTKD